MHIDSDDELWSYRCPTVPRLSAGCTLETDPSDYCCKVAVCRQITTPAPGQPTPPPTKPPSKWPSISLSKGSQISFQHPHPSNHSLNDRVSTVKSFTKLSPSFITISINVYTPAYHGLLYDNVCCVLVAFCVYKGVAYTQGQTWQDGCSTTCRCDDADNNIYNCFDRYISEEILFQKKSFMVFRNQFVITSFTISFQAKTTHTDVQFTIMN